MEASKSTKGRGGKIDLSPARAKKPKVIRRKTSSRRGQGARVRIVPPSGAIAKALKFLHKEENGTSVFRDPQGVELLRNLWFDPPATPDGKCVMHDEWFVELPAAPPQGTEEVVGYAVALGERSSDAVSGRKPGRERSGIIMTGGTLEGLPFYPALQAAAIADESLKAGPVTAAVSVLVESERVIGGRPSYGMLASHLTYGRNRSGKYVTQHAPISLSAAQLEELLRLLRRPEASA